MKKNTPSAKGLRGWLDLAASPTILFYALPWLMVLLVIGTIAQKDLGLYAAQNLYFSSWILWLGPIPLPGAYLTMGAITLCLLAKFLLYSPWRRHQAGIILSHLGVLILMIGGLLTAFSQEEGYLMLREGQSGSAVSSYHNRVLVIEKNGAQTLALPYETLVAGQSLDLPFSVKIDSLCRNCRPAPVKDAAERRGFAEMVDLRDSEAEKEDEANLSGVTFTITGIDEDQNGTYAVMEEIPHKPAVTFGDDAYVFSIGRAQTILPFAIELKDFRRELHPGTDMARDFSSAILVRDGDVAWPYTIRMNEPLRYKGYTFYQSSFSLRPDGEFSILSVVQNKGRIFPYIASAVIFAGLLLHLVIRLRQRREGTS